MTVKPIRARNLLTRVLHEGEQMKRRITEQTIKKMKAPGKGYRIEWDFGNPRLRRIYHRGWSREVHPELSVSLCGQD